LLRVEYVQDSLAIGQADTEKSGVFKVEVENIVLWNAFPKKGLYSLIAEIGLSDTSHPNQRQRLAWDQSKITISLRKFREFSLERNYLPDTDTLWQALCGERIVEALAPR
jgi:hypothetical protein